MGLIMATPMHPSDPISAKVTHNKGEERVFPQPAGGRNEECYPIDRLPCFKGNKDTPLDFPQGLDKVVLWRPPDIGARIRVDQERSAWSGATWVDRRTRGASVQEFRLKGRGAWGLLHGSREKLVGDGS